MLLPFTLLMILMATLLLLLLDGIIFRAMLITDITPRFAFFMLLLLLLSAPLRYCLMLYAAMLRFIISLYATHAHAIMIRCRC